MTGRDREPNGLLATTEPTAHTPRRVFLPFSPPTVGEEEIQEVVDTLRSDWITTGPKTQRFEQEFAQYIGAPAALALNSCTAALHTALVAMGVGPGDEVITSPLTFSATVNVVEHVGARPVLADVQPDTLNLDPEALARAITPRTRAILPVHYAGHAADLDAIYALAGMYDLPVLEDAAHALPAAYGGRRIGAGLNPVAFSFYATKNLTTAEGGMLTGDPELIERARVISLHGMSRDAWKRYAKGGSWRYDIVMPGFKYNMTDIQASMGLCQLRKLERFHARRARIAQLYNEAFAMEEALEAPSVREYVDPAWHLYVLRLRPELLRIGRDQFIDELSNRQIGTSVHFIPIHLHRYYRDRYNFQPDSFPVACANYLRMLSLPLHPRLSDADVGDVIDSVFDVVRTFRR
jgi:dTDP-4-amino-4,6-dideoxygalactose transaminase